MRFKLLLSVSVCCLLKLHCDCCVWVFVAFFNQKAFEEFVSVVGSMLTPALILCFLTCFSKPVYSPLFSVRSNVLLCIYTASTWAATEYIHRPLNNLTEAVCQPLSPWCLQVPSILSVCTDYRVTPVNIKTYFVCVFMSQLFSVLEQVCTWFW